MTDCVSCGGLLTGRQKKYCSSQCSKSAGRAAWIKKVYGLTLEQWDEIWEYQNRRCGVCQREPRAGETFHLDHEHTERGAGVCRGILCPYCRETLDSWGDLKAPYVLNSLQTISGNLQRYKQSVR